MDGLYKCLIYSFLVCFEIWTITWLLLKTIIKYDKESNFYISKVIKINILFFSLGIGVWITVVMGLSDLSIFSYGVLASYLLVATITDIQTYEVYDFLHIIGAFSGMAILIKRGVSLGNWQGLILFIGMQIIIFGRLYGLADCMGFCVCAIYISIRNPSTLMYLFHMALAFCMLGIVQGIKRNINGRGNLKKPVAFFPYITFSIWFFL